MYEVTYRVFGYAYMGSVATGMCYQAAARVCLLYVGGQICMCRCSHVFAEGFCPASVDTRETSVSAGAGSREAGCTHAGINQVDSVNVDTTLV